MKKFILTLSFITATVCIHQLQAQYWSLGAKGGASINSFSDFPTDEPLIGYNAGFFTWYSTQGALAFGGDLIYTRKGGEYDRLAEGILINRTYETALDYFAISPKIGLFLRDYDSRFRPKITFGPSIGLLVDATDVNSGRDMEREFETLNVGLVLGTGFNYEVVNAIWLNVDVDYNYGLTNTSSIEDVVHPDRLTNQGLGLNLGVSFGIGNTEEE